MDVELVAAQLRKKGHHIPSFPTILKTVKELKKNGWLEKRKIRGRTYYYLSDNAKRNMME